MVSFRKRGGRTLGTYSYVEIRTRKNAHVTAVLWVSPRNGGREGKGKSLQENERMSPRLHCFGDDCGIMVEVRLSPLPSGAGTSLMPHALFSYRYFFLVFL